MEVHRMKDRNLRHGKMIIVVAIKHQSKSNNIPLSHRKRPCQKLRKSLTSFFQQRQTKPKHIKILDIISHLCLIIAMAAMMFALTMQFKHSVSSSRYCLILLTRAYSHIEMNKQHTNSFSDTRCHLCAHNQLVY